jgi:hypothetical protein
VALLGVPVHKHQDDKVRRMKKFAGIVLLLVLLVSCFWRDSYSSTSKVKSFVSRASMGNLLQVEHLRPLLAQQNEDSNMVRSLDTLKLKDPNMALFYAVVPGFVVHGAGHFYAEAKTTGWILIGGEVISLGLLTYAIGVGIGESTNGSSSNGDAEIAGIIGGTLFVSTWICDMIGAPLAVQRYNEGPHRNKSVDLKFDFDDTTDLIQFQIVKRF